MLFITQGKTNWKFIVIVIVLAILVSGGILSYQYWWLPRHEVKPSEVKLIKVKQPEEKTIQATEEKICSFPQNILEYSKKSIGWRIDQHYQVRDKNCLFLSPNIIVFNSQTVYNSQVNKQFKCVDDFSGKLSPDGKHFAYIGVQDGSISWDGYCKGSKYVAVADNQAGKIYDNISQLTFSPDSQHFAYVAETKGKYFIVLDNKEGKIYDAIGEFVFSYDSKRLAYVARNAGQSGQYFVVLDEQIGKKYDHIGELTFFPDDQHFAYVACEGIQQEKCFTVIDGQEGKKYDNLIYYLTFSPDNQHFAYVATEGKKMFTILDNKEGKNYDYIIYLTFSPDSQHFAYSVTEGGKHFVVLDSQESEKKYDGYVYKATLSSDAKHLTYEACKGIYNCFVVLDNQEGKEYSGFWDLAFSSDNKLLTYSALSGNDIYYITELVK